MSRRERTYHPSVERLEVRDVPAVNTFAQWMGQLTPASPAAEVMPMRVTSGNFVKPNGEVLVGFNFRAEAGSGLDPANVKILRSDPFNRVITPTLFQSAKTAADNSALTIVAMRNNQYRAHITGANGTTGFFVLETYLVGDVNSDFQVDAGDIAQMTAKQDLELGQAGYVREADANLDGIIDTNDLTLATRNLGVSTTIRPLQITATVSENGIAEANGVVRGQDISIATHVTRPVSFLYGNQGVDDTIELKKKVGAGGNTTFQVNANPGLNSVRFIANSGAFGQRAIRTVHVIRGNAVTEWNATMLQAITATGTNPPRASRIMAIVQGAIFDAVNALEGSPFTSYSGTVFAPSEANVEATIAGAAFHTLNSLFPTQSALLTAARDHALTFVPDGEAETLGLAFGATVAQDFLELRADDNSNLVVPYTPGDEPGEWIPTPTGFAPSLLPNWPLVTPFTMTSGDQFRPDGPPGLGTIGWAAAFHEVKLLGSVNSTVRTSDQTEIALFWADGGGTHTPPGHWNVIAQDITARNGQNLLQTARTFALMNFAMADAGIASWDAKYAYNFWRPVTAIRAADTDGNEATEQDETWTPLIATPPFPEYTSGHSTFSGAADAVLTAIFGEQSFRAPTQAFSNQLRSFSSFTEAADEAGRSRIYGGIHYQFASDDGKAAGRAIGQQAVGEFLLPTT
jgi:hypothetical protein